MSHELDEHPLLGREAIARYSSSSNLFEHLLWAGTCANLSRSPLGRQVARVLVDLQGMEGDGEDFELSSDGRNFFTRAEACSTLAAYLLVVANGVDAPASQVAAATLAVSCLRLIGVEHWHHDNVRWELEKLTARRELPPSILNFLEEARDLLVADTPETARRVRAMLDEIQGRARRTATAPTAHAPPAPSPERVVYFFKPDKDRGRGKVRGWIDTPQRKLGVKGKGVMIAWLDTLERLARGPVIATSEADVKLLSRVQAWSRSQALDVTRNDSRWTCSTPFRVVALDLGVQDQEAELRRLLAMPDFDALPAPLIDDKDETPDETEDF